MVQTKEERYLQRKKYREENKDILKQQYNNWYKENKDKRKEYNKEYSIEYRKNNKNKRKEYRDNNKDSINKKAREWRYNNPEKMKIFGLKQYAERKEWGNPEPLNNWFEGSHFHHLHVDSNHKIGIFIPEELHRSISHSYNDQESMNKINNIVIKWYGDDDN